MKFLLVWIICISFKLGRTQVSKCGVVNINPRTTICCNGLTYVKSGPKPGCCGNIGFDSLHYYCCGKTIIRKNRYKVPRCCGERGYDGMFDTCVDGYLDKKTALGSHCCMTEMGWKCCPRGGNCCSYSGSGQVEIPGFRPACCDLRSYTEKAQCCANTAEMTSVIPSCCDNERYRPKCCVLNDGSTECCPGGTGTCCRHHRIPEPLRPEPTRAPHRYTPYPVATVASFTRTRSEQQCCTITRRSCCSKPISSYALQPCCYSIYKPTCCYTMDKYKMSCCSKHNIKHQDIPKLKTAKVGSYNNNPYYTQSGGNFPQTRRPSYNQQTRRPSYNQNTRPPYHQQTRRPSYNHNTRQLSYNQQTRKPSYNQQTRRPSYNQQTRRPSYNQQTRQPSYNQETRRPYNRHTRRPSYYHPTRRPSYNQQTRRPSYNQNYYTRHDNQNRRGQTTDDRSSYYKYNTGRPSYNQNEQNQYTTTKAPSYNRDQYDTCCNALSKTMCCIEGYRLSGKVPRCCPSSTTDGRMRPIYRTPDPVYIPEGNQAFQGIHYNQNPTDWMPEEEIIDQKEYMDFNKGSNRIKTKKPVTEPKFVPDYGYAPFGGSYPTENKNNIPNGPGAIIGNTAKPGSTVKQMHLDIKVYRPTGDSNSESNVNDSINVIETTTPHVVDEVQEIRTLPVYGNINDKQNKEKLYDNKTVNNIGNEVINQRSTPKPFPYLTDKNGIISESDLMNPEDEINDEDENEYILVPLPEEPPLEPFKPDYYNNYFDNYDYEHFKCDGEPYDLGVHICCDGILRFRIGVEPKCCSTEAYDAFLYNCCDGVIRRSCDPKYEPKMTAWGKFI